MFCYLWRAVLSHNDWTLGLNPHFGKAGGYRRRILQMLEQWEVRSNQLLQTRLDPITGEEEVLRVRIVSETPERSGMASGFDSDWSYDDDND